MCGEMNLLIEEDCEQLSEQCQKSRNRWWDHQSQLLSSWNDVRIKVFNTGDHIPQEDIDKLWVKFYKSIKQEQENTVEAESDCLS